MVEFALVLPVLLLLIFGIFDFGRCINYWIDSTHLANEAARYAAVGNTPSACGGNNLATCIRNQADSPELRNGSNSVVTAVKVCVNAPASTTVGTPIVATATFTYQWFSFLGISATTTQVSTSATMRLENYNANVVGCSP